MPKVAASCGHIFKIDFFLLESLKCLVGGEATVSPQGSPRAKGKAQNLHLHLQANVHLLLHKESFRHLLMLGRCTVRYRGEKCLRWQRECTIGNMLCSESDNATPMSRSSKIEG